MPKLDTAVVGLDIGGTSTRATVLTLTGQRLGTGRAAWAATPPVTARNVPPSSC